MKTIKDLKNYVKHNSRIVLKDCIDTTFFNYSEWAIIQEMKNKVKKKSKAIYKEFRDILDNDNLPLIVGNYKKYILGNTKYFQKNLIKNEIIIGMGAGTISSWMRSLKDSLLI